VTRICRRCSPISTTLVRKICFSYELPSVSWGGTSGASASPLGRCHQEKERSECKPARALPSGESAERVQARGRRLHGSGFARRMPRGVVSEQQPEKVSLRNYPSQFLNCVSIRSNFHPRGYGNSIRKEPQHSNRLMNCRGVLPTTSCPIFLLKTG
jgi:hypothetical protein